MARFFFEPYDRDDEGIWVRGEEAAHAIRTLRLKQGDDITLLDGQGIEYGAVIQAVEKAAFLATPDGGRPCPGEPGIETTVFQGLPKLDKLELVVQKCVEMGACQIVPVLFARCVARALPEDRLLRLNRIAREAAKQSGRGIAPQVAPLLSFKGFCEMVNGYSPAVLLYEREEQIPLKRALSGASGKRAAIITGPEGGIEPEEAAMLKEAGARMASLGKRVLRTETAALAALACMMYERGEMAP